jgi:uncharacterized caspase-like protein
MPGTVSRLAARTGSFPWMRSCEADVDIDHEAIGLKGVLVTVEPAVGLGLIILDACRNNPFAAKMKRTVRTRAVARGLGQIEPTGNVLVAYAAKAGTLAADGTGRNSPFTAALLRHIERPGLEINFLFRHVRDDVIRATNHEQQPFVYGSLSREAIYLNSATAAPLPPLPALPEGPAGDEIAWTFLKDSRNPEAFKRFLEQFPASPLRRQAEARLAALTADTKEAAPSRVPEFELTYWNTIKESTNISEFESYLKAYPDGAFAPLAKLRIEQLRRDGAKPADKAAPARKRDGIKTAKREPATRAAPTQDARPAGGGAAAGGFPGGPPGSLRGTGTGRRCLSGDAGACELLRARCAAGGMRACMFVSGARGGAAGGGGGGRRGRLAPP